MADQITANLNSTECLVTKTHFGYDTVLNICSNVTRDLSWAFGDWAGFAVLTMLALAVFGMIGFFLVVMIRDEFF